jgi:hypothetical protein
MFGAAKPVRVISPFCLTAPLPVAVPLPCWHPGFPISFSVTYGMVWTAMPLRGCVRMREQECAAVLNASGARHGTTVLAVVWPLTIQLPEFLFSLQNSIARRLRQFLRHGKWPGARNPRVNAVEFHDWKSTSTCRPSFHSKNPQSAGALQAALPNDRIRFELLLRLEHHRSAERTPMQGDDRVTQ